MATLSITSLHLPSPITPTSFRHLPAIVAFSGHLSHRNTRWLLLYPPIATTSFRPLHLPTPAVFPFSDDFIIRKRRGFEVVTRAGANTTTYLFAALFPLSLLAITIFTSIKIADKLDKDFLEDVTLNQAVKEAAAAEEKEEEDEEEEEEDDDDAIYLEEIVKEPVLPRTRNRPKREV